MRLALIDDLLSEALPAGSNLLVEYDAASQWYRASLNITREWLRAGGEVGYNVAAQLPDNLRKLGLNVEEFEAGGKLEIWDWYTAALGQKSKEKFVGSSTLKAAEHRDRERGIKACDGQESDQTTWGLCKMNLAKRGIESDFVKWNNQGSFLNDEHKDLKADFILANPPFNDSDWGGELLQDDAEYECNKSPRD